MVHQSGGCCDGSSPMCFPRDEFVVGAHDVLLGLLLPGTAAETPVWISGPQYAHWSHTHLTVDVVRGRGAGFSLEAPRGVRFLVRSRLFDEAETRLLAELGAPRTGPDAYRTAPAVPP